MCHQVNLDATIVMILVAFLASMKSLNTANCHA